MQTQSETESKITGLHNPGYLCLEVADIGVGAVRTLNSEIRVTSPGENS